MSADLDGSSVLVQRLQSGDEQALAELFCGYRERLRRMIQFRMDRRLQGRADPSDVLQEAYIDAQKRVHHYVAKPEMPFYLWLRQVTMQRLIDTHRRHLTTRKRTAAQEVSIDAGDPSRASSGSMAWEIVAGNPSPSQAAMQAETLQMVEQALERMDPIDREVLALRHFEQLSNNEVAELLELAKAAASNRYVRALTRLRTILAELAGYSSSDAAE